MNLGLSIADDNTGSRYLEKKRGRKEKKSWVFGLGWNVVDDNGKWFQGLFSVRKVWNIRWFPSQAFAEVFNKSGVWSFGTVVSYNLYKTGKEINHLFIAGRFPFLSADLYAKLHIRELANLDKQYDIYVPMGAGYTLRTLKPYHNTITLNIGLGMVYWINDKIGINASSMAKFGMRSPFFKSGSNYLQHSLSVVYLLDRSPRKRYSRPHPRYKWVHDKRKLETLH